MGAEGERVASRLARGVRAFAVREGGAIVSYGWLSAAAEWIGELDLEITPAPGEGYVWNCFTLEPQRRRGHYRSMLEGIVSVARSEGFRRLWIGSVDVPAEKADTDAGFIRVLSFEVAVEGARRRLEVSAIPGVEEQLVTEARKRLGLSRWRHVGTVSARVH
jgi:GNAT superfamily N-acetyltransferase